MFGHERGAFTGAAGSRHGLLTTANRGTIFLDEIGEMPRGCRRTLRVLETRGASRRCRPGDAGRRARDRRKQRQSDGLGGQGRVFARISFIGFKWFLSSLRRCASVVPTSHFWQITFSSVSEIARPDAKSQSAARRWWRCGLTTGPAMFANSRNGGAAW